MHLIKFLLYFVAYILILLCALWVILFYGIVDTFSGCVSFQKLEKQTPSTEHFDIGDGDGGSVRPEPLHLFSQCLVAKYLKEKSLTLIDHSWLSVCKIF